MTRIGGTPPRHTLDRVLATRTHVRLLRAFAVADPGENVTARDAARRAGVGNASAWRVLPGLEAEGIVTARRYGDYGLFHLNEEHFLAPGLLALFDDELHEEEALIAYVRSAARASGRTVRARIAETPDGEAVVLLSGRGLDGWEAGMWLDRLEEGIRSRFGTSMPVHVEQASQAAPLDIDRPC